jgi:hypothetical protein
MLCPAFSRRRMGISTFPRRTVATREIRNACKYLIGRNLAAS